MVRGIDFRVLQMLDLFLALVLPWEDELKNEKILSFLCFQGNYLQRLFSPRSVPCLRDKKDATPNIA